MGWTDFILHVQKMTAVTVSSEFQFDRWSLTAPFPPHLYPPPSQSRASRVARWYPHTLTAWEPTQPELSGQKHARTHTHAHSHHHSRFTLKLSVILADTGVLISP